MFLEHISRYPPYFRISGMYLINAEGTVFSARKNIERLCRKVIVSRTCYERVLISTAWFLFDSYRQMIFIVPWHSNFVCHSWMCCNLFFNLYNTHFRLIIVLLLCIPLSLLFLHSYSPHTLMFLEHISRYPPYFRISGMYLINAKGTVFSARKNIEQLCRKVIVSRTCYERVYR